MYRMCGAAAGLTILIAPVLARAAEPVLSEATLEDGRLQRVLYAAPENPRAILIMLPGGNGMVEFGPDGAFRRMGDSFLLRTLPLWQAQGFAVAVLTPPNGMSLLGYRHTPPMPRRSVRRSIICSRAERSGLADRQQSGDNRRGRRRRPPRPEDRRHCRHVVGDRPQQRRRNAVRQ